MSWFQSRMASVETDLYTKPTDKHQYLFISSCHSDHTKCSIPYSLALHLCHICSSHDSYIHVQHTDELINYTLLIVVMTKPFPQHKYSMPQTFLVLTHLKTNFLHGLKPLPLLLHVILHCLCPLLLRTL